MVFGIPNEAATGPYHVTPTGYEIPSYDADVQPLVERYGGNHPLDSERRMDPDDPSALGLERLVEGARREATEMAREPGLGDDKVPYDADGEAAALEDLRETASRGMRRQAASRIGRVCRSVPSSGTGRPIR